MTLDECVETFRADYDLATEKQARSMTQAQLAQGATAEWTEYQVEAFIELRLEQREQAVAKMREIAAAGSR